jgi:hypothetical protein
MHVAQTVAAAYRTLFANLGPFVLIALSWVVLSALPSFFANLVMGANLPEPDQATLVEAAPAFLMLMISLAAAICVAIVWYRFVLLKEPLLRLLPSTMDTVAPYTVRLLLLMIPTVAWFSAVVWATWEDDSAAPAAIIVVGTSFFFALCARFLLILPAAATGDRALDTRASWRATAGHGLSIFAGMLACDLPLIILIAAVDFATYDYDLHTWGSIASTALSQFLDFIRIALTSSFLAFAYQTLTSPIKAQADHFS